MSTPATIQVDDVTFFCDYDGYPRDVLDFMSEDIKKAQERAGRNPDYPFFANLKYILIDADLEFESGICSFPSQYQYKVDKDGKIYVMNPKGHWVEFWYIFQKDTKGYEVPVELVIKNSEGMERSFDDWDDYEEVFTCHCEFDETRKSVKLVYRMVDTDGCLEEHLVCPSCGKDEGVV